MKACDFSRAEFNGARLGHANMSDGVFFRSLVCGTFDSTNLSGADFEQAYLTGAIFRNVDLSEVRNLGQANCYPENSIDARTIVLSGRLPKLFYRSCGLPDELARQVKAKSTSVRCFLSYASYDESFVRTLHRDLEKNGIETWFAPSDLEIGARLRPSFDKAIVGCHKLILVLSKRSIKSHWVEQEVETAFEQERLQNRTILVPICIDSAVMKSRSGWAAHLRRTRNIGFFPTKVRDEKYFDVFYRLIGDIRSNDTAKY